MVILSPLPFELILDIFHLAILSCCNDELPIVGLNAAWNIPIISEFKHKLALSASVQPSHARSKSRESVSSYVDLNAKRRCFLITSYELARKLRL
jgi:hypothetical protein